MSNNGGPLDLWHVLQRRRVSFDRWCEEMGIQTCGQFLDAKAQIDAKGEFCISDEMMTLGLALPASSEEMEEKITSHKNALRELVEVVENTENSSMTVSVDPPTETKKSRKKTV